MVELIFITVRILLLSDIHTGFQSGFPDIWIKNESTENKPDDNSLEDDLLLKLKEIRSIDYLIITGDLTSSGYFNEFKMVKELIDKISKTINIDKNKIFVTPGNHDLNRHIIDLCKIDQDNPDIYRDLNFRLFPEKDQTDGKTKYGIIPHSYVYNDDKVQIIQLNSISCITKEGQDRGEIGNKQYSWLKEILTDDLSNQYRIIIFHHHHLRNDPRPIIPDLSVMIDGPRLHNLIKEKGADLVIHGHKHIPFMITIHENDMVHPYTRICSGSLSVHSKYRNMGNAPNYFHIINIEGRCDKTKAIKGFVNSYSRRYKGQWDIPTWSSDEYIHPIQFFGPLFSKEETIKEIEQFILSQKHLNIILLPKYQKIPDSFKCWNVIKLNSFIKEIAKEKDMVMIGEYPTDVYLKKK